MSKLSEKGQFRPIQSVLTAPNYRPGIIKTNWYADLGRYTQVGRHVDRLKKVDIGRQPLVGNDRNVQIHSLPWVDGQGQE